MGMLGIDHAVLAVRDLAAARKHLTRLGFTTQPASDLPDRGISTCVVRLGLDVPDVLEIRAVVDADRACASDLDGPALVDYVEQHGGGLAGYAVRTTDLAGMGRQMDETSMRAFTHLRYDGPYTLGRQTPDGRQLTWRMLMPGGVAWRRPWPMLVQWETSDAERRTLEPPEGHPNTATGISSIALAVANLESARAIYRDQMGLEAMRLDEVPSLAALRATYRIGGCTIQLLAPRNIESPLGATLARGGEGPFELTLAVSDLEACRSLLERAGVAYHTAPGNPDALALEPAEALGARLVFTTAVPFAVAYGRAGDAEQASAERGVERAEAEPAGRT